MLWGIGFKVLESGMYIYVDVLIMMLGMIELYNSFKGSKGIIDRGV